MDQPTSGARPAVDRRTLDRWRRAIIVCFAMGGITVTAWGPRLPTLKADFGIGTATIGLLLSGATVGAVAGLVASTPVLHRLGSRRGVAGSLLIVAAALATMGVATTLRSVPLLGTAFAVVGFGIGVLDVLINVEGSANERAEGRTLLPRMHAAWSIGAVVGAAIGAACAALGITPSVQFIGEAILVGAAALSVVHAIPLGRRQPDGAASEKRFAKVRKWLACWADKRLLLIGLVMLGVEVGEGSANTWLTLAMHSDHGLTAAVAAAFFTVFAGAEALARIFGGPVVDWIGRAATVRYTTALGVAGMVLFIVGGNLWLVIVGVVLWAVGVSMGFPLGMSAAAEGGANPAARVSVVAAIGYFANLAGPPAIGTVAQHSGLLDALWIVAVCMLLACGLAGSLRPVSSGSSGEG